MENRVIICLISTLYYLKKTEQCQVTLLVCYKEGKNTIWTVFWEMLFNITSWLLLIRGLNIMCFLFFWLICTFFRLTFAVIKVSSCGRGILALECAVFLLLLSLSFLKRRQLLNLFMTNGVIEHRASKRNPNCKNAIYTYLKIFYMYT